MDAALERLVRQRAGGRCEYCRLPQAGPASPSRSTTSSPASIGAARSPATSRTVCVYCNGYKGPNISGLDPATGKLTPLFHPRRHKWSHHFRYEGGTLVGRTAIGRTTVEVLRINLPNLVELREVLMEDGVW